MNNRCVLLALHHVPGIGPKFILSILSRWQSLVDFYKTASRGALGPDYKLLVESLNWQLVDEDLLWAQGTNHHLITYLDENYPKLLRQLANAPPVIYAKGDMQSLRAKTLAVVGSRHPSDYGIRVAHQWCRYFAEQGLVMVSGLAIGIDTLVHQASVACGRPTIAVLGSGLDWIYPRQNLTLAQKIMHNGLILSEFPLKMRPNARHFPRRNRIISGLALSTLIVESTIKSGTMHTSQHAVEQNREVLVVPGRVDDPLSQGCNYLIQQGASLMTSAKDVVDAVNNVHNFIRPEL